MGVKRKLQVFVSSTYTDLLAERQAAVEAILKSGHIPAGMELFSAGDKSQLEVIYKWIDESDVFMLILGARYGSVDPDSGCSYTELEYNYARTKGKPSFAVVIADEAIERKVQELGRAAIERHNPCGLENFRALVLTNVSEFFHEPKDIKLSVLASLRELSNDDSLGGWVSARGLPDLETVRTELEMLRRHNVVLASELAAARGALGDQSQARFEALARLFSATVLDIPGEFAGEPAGSKINLNLQQVLDVFGDDLVNGVTNTRRDEISKFLYNRVFPKLQVHGVAENEKPSGALYRRSFLNKLGREYLAWIAAKRLVDKLSP